MTKRKTADYRQRCVLRRQRCVLRRLRCVLRYQAPHPERVEQSQNYVTERSDRLHASARNEVTEVQEQAYHVYSHKDEKTSEQIIAMNQLQLRLQQMEMAESQHEAAQDQQLRMQKYIYSEERQGRVQRPETTSSSISSMSFAFPGVLHSRV